MHWTYGGYLNVWEWALKKYPIPVWLPSKIKAQASHTGFMAWVSKRMGMELLEGWLRKYKYVEDWLRVCTKRGHVPLPSACETAPVTSRLPQPTSTLAGNSDPGDTGDTLSDCTCVYWCMSVFQRM